jgi:CheY-like chemotaxis protein
MPTQHIVVADDNTLYLQMLRDLLTEKGYPEVQCIHGPLTFDLIRQVQPAVVIVDIDMGHPGEGWRILDLLRLHPSTTHIPVIVCSTDPRILNAKAAWLEDMRCAAIEKPFDLETLLAKVQTLLGPPVIDDRERTV